MRNPSPPLGVSRSGGRAQNASGGGASVALAILKLLDFLKAASRVTEGARSRRNARSLGGAPPAQLTYHPGLEELSKELAPFSPFSAGRT
eukprot:scaffold153929_cov31-Tisochrysis_lutea.AAC.3